MQAVTIKTVIEGHETKTVVDEHLGKDLAFDAIRKFIGRGTPATIERLTFNWGEMWCDEEGKLVSLPVRNDMATRIAREGHMLYPGDFIAGDVVLRIKKGYTFREGSILREAVSKKPKMSAEEKRMWDAERAAAHGPRE